jgi:hypothetical protein
MEPARPQPVSTTGQPGGQAARRRNRAPSFLPGSLTAPWTIAQLARAADIEPGTARDCTERLVEGGTVEDLGEDPRHDGDGPAPSL